ncbi:GNAT family N-acetyltransferase [Actinopolymorpha sp. B9G3]|uniref:GNAT family N-acetyltransferase n=1 Tax=Actinopolymorpha sp. B9G3 TaxID=3158970 RepID=UPI0032D8FA2F
MDTAAGPSLTVRPLEQPAEMKASVELYRAVLELGPSAPAVSPRLLWALRRNGGSVIGAFDGERLVGFAYGFVGKDATSGEVYHYSQAAVVHPQWQGRGVGRALKSGQRAYVLGTGITTMRWSYDPVRAGNGHFNLDVLGARARWFVPNLYGVEDMGRDPGHPSDRLIVEWDLAGPPAPPAVDQVPTRLPGWGELVREGTDMLIGIPRSWSDVAREPDRAKQVRTAVSTAFERTLGQGYVGVSCRADDTDSAWYRLRPASASIGLTPAAPGSPSATGDRTQRP